MSCYSEHAYATAVASITMCSNITFCSADFTSLCVNWILSLKNITCMAKRIAIMPHLGNIEEIEPASTNINRQLERLK